MSALVLRLSSLGDVVLAGAVTRGLGPVHFLTAPNLHPLVARFPGVVSTLAPGDPLPSVELVVDLQRSLRSRRLLIGTSPSRVSQQRPLRLARVMAKLQRAPTPVVQRYAHAAGVQAQAEPWVQIERHPERLVLVPGAAHATKRWPHFYALRQALGESVDWLGGPSDGPMLAALAQAGDRQIAESGVKATLASLEGAALVIGGDTGLLHLAAACGVPTLALFGPTHPFDGYWTHPDPPLSLRLPCSPCSKHGSARCILSDHLCMQGLSVDAVLEQIRVRR